MNFSTISGITSWPGLHYSILKLSGLLLALILATPSQAETVQTGQIMAGTRYQTPYYIKRGEQPGPTIVIIGGCHGDEPAGYLAARLLKNWTITKGTLVLVPDAHIEAIRRKVRAYPGNMNRMFPGRPNGDAMEQLAYQLWELTKNSRPDLLLTLHESRGFYVEDRSRYGQTFTYDFHELNPLMGKVAARVNRDISPAKHHFRLKVEPFETCPTYVAWKYLRVPATSIETAKPLPLATRIRYQLAAVQCFMDEIGLKYRPGRLIRSVAAAPRN